MLFDVRPILHTPGKRLEFQFEMDLSDMEFGGRCPISRPVQVEGKVHNSADVLELSLTARTTLDAVCDRCGKAFLQDKTIPYTCLLAEELENEDNDEIVLLEDGKVVAVGGIVRISNGVHPRDGHKNIVFGRLQRTVSPVRCRSEPRPLFL